MADSMLILQTANLLDVEDSGLCTSAAYARSNAAHSIPTDIDIDAWVAETCYEQACPSTRNDASQGQSVPICAPRVPSTPQIKKRSSKHGAQEARSSAKDVENPRRRQSCSACSESKVRCSKEKPTCRRCGERGYNCNYDLAKRFGRPHRKRQDSTEPATKHSTWTLTAHAASKLNSEGPDMSLYQQTGVVHPMLDFVPPASRRSTPLEHEPQASQLLIDGTSPQRISTDISDCLDPSLPPVHTSATLEVEIAAARDCQCLSRIFDLLDVQDGGSAYPERAARAIDLALVETCLSALTCGCIAHDVRRLGLLAHLALDLLNRMMPQDEERLHMGGESCFEKALGLVRAVASSLQTFSQHSSRPWRIGMFANLWTMIMQQEQGRACC